jgi:SAM-dependent methyltransferase
MHKRESSGAAKLSTQGANLDGPTVASFGDEWANFDQLSLRAEERNQLFARYFSIFNWDALPKAARGFDMGCGSGRWATLVAPQVGHLTCIDPSEEALSVAKCALQQFDNVEFLQASANETGLPPASQDFGYSLGVLHHVPDTQDALNACCSLLKPGAPFLVYLYYRFDTRPLWFRMLWRVSNLVRLTISQCPKHIKAAATDAIAVLVYWPLARFAGLVEYLGGNPAHLPLSFYRATSLYTMRTDSRDRFGTPLEQRFTRAEITRMLQIAGLVAIRFSDQEPFWVATGIKGS